MRTTATYDVKTKEFILHTPDFQAAKCWAGNLGSCLNNFLKWRYSYKAAYLILQAKQLLTQSFLQRSSHLMVRTTDFTHSSLKFVI